MKTDTHREEERKNKRASEREREREREGQKNEMEREEEFVHALLGGKELAHLQGQVQLLGGDKAGGVQPVHLLQGGVQGLHTLQQLAGV